MLIVFFWICCFCKTFKFLFNYFRFSKIIHWTRIISSFPMNSIIIFFFHFSNLIRITCELNTSSIIVFFFRLTQVNRKVYWIVFITSPFIFISVCFCFCFVLSRLINLIANVLFYFILNQILYNFIQNVIFDWVSLLIEQLSYFN